MDLTKYHNKGRTGLENLGNTCFLNSSLQVLNHTYELNEFLSSEKYSRLPKANLPDTDILNEWNELRNIMWSGNGIVAPKKFVYNVHKIAKQKNRDLFTGFAQNDMPEFLLFMMDCIHNSICRTVNMRVLGNPSSTTDEIAVKCYTALKTIYEKEYSEIMEMFYGMYVSEIGSIDGKISHFIKPESYFILDLPMIHGNEMATNLYGCFDLFVRCELLEGDNAWYNETTQQKENVRKQITFWNFPNILVISLKRFTPDGRGKINQLVDFPLENLNLSKYVRGYNAKSFVYDLYGVCNHMGGPAGGHYTSFVKNATNEWYHYNDRNVTPITEAAAIVTPMAYCLFYRKKNNLI
jgi:ubiquitin carboxyl-terminal hydrolase 8